MDIKNYLENNKRKIFIALAAFIFLVGIFLRAYNFRDWLYFYPDQARDVTIAKNAIEGKSSWPLMGAIAASTRFKIGPIYYYFQIITGEIAGVRPETMAYPDLLFGILSIPLFYFFLKKYFTADIALALTGLFSVSFYAIKYSRFAWNSNPTPFFVLLFLMSLLALIENGKKISWKWILGAGISLGVGMQLHTTLFVLLPLTAFFVFVWVLKKELGVWKKIALIMLVVLMLNAGQLISEMRTNFSNTRLLLNISKEGSQSKSNFFNSLKLDTLCHAQFNAYMLTSLGHKEDCNFPTILEKQSWKITNWSIMGIFFGVVFSIFGYAMLLYRFFREKETEKKHFLGLIILFIILCFLIFYTVADTLLLRYFINLAFVPFLFIGFFIQFIKKHPKIFWPIAVCLFLFLILANLVTISAEAKALSDKNRSEAKYVVLGEIEPIADYIISHSPGNQAYFTGNDDYFWNYYKPLLYICDERGFKLLRGEKVKKVPPGTLLFALDKSSKRSSANATELNINHLYFEVEDYKNFGRIGIYKLKN